MKLLSILIIALASSYSYADHHGESKGNMHNEAVWQARGGKNAVRAGYTYSNQTFQSELSPANDVDTNINNITLGYERGLNDMFAVGINLDYLTFKTTGPYSSGLNHLGLDFKANHKLGFGGLYYGLDADFGLENREADNTSTGGIDLAPHIALVFGNRHLGYGLRASYNFDLEKTFEDSTGNETTQENGNTFNLELFFEKSLSDKSLFGVSVAYEAVEFTEDENGNEIGDESKGFEFSVYGAVGCGCSSGGLHFLPRFTLITTEFEDGAGIETETSGGNYAIEMALRKEF